MSKVLYSFYNIKQLQDGGLFSYGTHKRHFIPILHVERRLPKDNIVNKTTIQVLFIYINDCTFYPTFVLYVQNITERGSLCPAKWKQKLLTGDCNISIHIIK